jgi:quercetin 2,3-dioxygenase
MINVHKAENRYSNDHGWLKTNFSFSFADYYDPKNIQFGALRVLNDDIIAPQKGFGSHPHREMEIVSIVLAGFLKHEDSTGTTATTTFGGVQRMSAGTGIVHSEVNPSDTEEVNLLQLWFLPEKEGLAPSYEQTSFDITNLKNNLLPVVTKNAQEDTIAKINQDLTIYLSDLEEEKELSFEQLQGRRTYIFVIEGKLLLNDETPINKRDDARITEVTTLNIKALANSRFMLIDLP